jgi:eukaryotic-like serine/threonine-protein kinase
MKMPDRTGQQLGNYRLVRLLGRGGFAEVYLGEHRYLKSYAALKVLRTSLKDEDVERFLSEAQTLVRLTHPNIVRVLEFAVDRGTPVLIMDYAPGGTLRQHHPRGTCLSLATTVAYTKWVAAALQYAHNHNVIHRDVKPENILIGPGQQLLLSDFGIALLSPSPQLLSTPDMAGTLPYTAPEQLRGNPSFASDQYSLGIVVYEWLCGERPFEGTYWQVIHQHMVEAPPSLRDSFPELPAAVEDVVLKALAKDPQQRYVSVQAFAHAVLRFTVVDNSDFSPNRLTVSMDSSYPSL